MIFDKITERKDAERIVQSIRDSDQNDSIRIMSDNLSLSIYKENGNLHYDFMPFISPQCSSYPSIVTGESQKVASNEQTIDFLWKHRELYNRWIERSNDG